MLKEADRAQERVEVTEKAAHTEDTTRLLSLREYVASDFRTRSKTKTSPDTAWLAILCRCLSSHRDHAGPECPAPHPTGHLDLLRDIVELGIDYAMRQASLPDLIARGFFSTIVYAFGAPQKVRAERMKAPSPLARLHSLHSPPHAADRH